jgi:tetratricopeptide (TPR) repeat protein
MKRRLFIVLLLFASFTGFGTSSKPTLDNSRAEYLTALSDYLTAQKVYESFLNGTTPTAKILAYQIAFEGIITKTTCNIFKKMKYLTKSEDSFKKAINVDSNDLEIRFIRLAVQFNISEYLGFSNKIQADKEFILKHAPSFDFHCIPATLGDKIIGFVHGCEKSTAVQIETIGNFLITFQKTTP